MKISLDTNILIDTPEVVFDESREFVISFTVIRELDKLKRNPDVKRSAQQAIKNIWNQYSKDKITILNVPTLLGESPDERIIQDAKDAESSILSNDIAVRIIAKAHGIDISEFEHDNEIDYDYSGYIEVKGDVNYEQKFVQIKELPLIEFNELFGTDLKENEYCIIDRIVEKNDIWANQRGKVSRISQSMKPYRDADILLDPLDSVQMCVLDSVFDSTVPLTVISGALGTGKTLLTLMAALARTTGQSRLRTYDKVLVTKPPISINKDLYTGFKPGTSEEKLGGHLGGIKSNLKFLLDRRTSQQTKKGEEPKATKSDEVWQEHFGVIEIDEIQGTSLHHTILIVDEFQLLDTDSLKLVLSRISEGSKVILVGDTEGQTYGVNRGREGFKTLYRHLGTSPEFSYIKLENIYRSALAKFVEKIFS